MRPMADKILVGLFAACLAFVAFRMTEAGEAKAVWVCVAIPFASSSAFILGVRWCRWIVGPICLLFALAWLLLPAAQHEIDRQFPFWLIWSLVEVFTVSTALACFTTPKSKKPNQPVQPTPGTGSVSNFESPARRG
jgi:hypothetical protein